MNRSTRALRSPALAALGFLFAGSLSATPFFTGIGVLPGEPESRAWGLSGDGLVVIGTSGPASGGLPIYWTQADGLNIIQGGFGNSPTSYPSAASTDGSVIVGESGGQAYRWSESNPVITGLGLLPGTSDSGATAVSADGSVIVGNSGDGAFRWTDGTGMAEITGLAGETQTRAYGISGDGSVVVGSSGTGTPDGSGFAVRWDESGFIVLGTLGVDAIGDVATAISSDGQVIAGQSNGLAFRWTDSDGMSSLGLLPGASMASATAVSGDGSVILGYTDNALFVWDALSGMRDLQSILTLDFGLNLTDWTLTNAFGLSDDGRVFAGWGINPQGMVEGWVASTRGQPPLTVPEPGPAWLLLGALAGLLVARRRP